MGQSHDKLEKFKMISKAEFWKYYDIKYKYQSNLLLYIHICIAIKYL